MVSLEISFKFFDAHYSCILESDFLKCIGFKNPAWCLTLFLDLRRTRVKVWSEEMEPEIGNSSKITITITFEIFNVLLQLLSYFFVLLQ